MADWLNTITVNIVLAPLPPARAGFGILMFLVNQDDGNSLNSARTMSFSSAAEAQTAQTAGYISATTLDFLQAAFSQQPTPSKVKVGYRDVTGAETMAAALAAIRAADDDWYAIVAYHRTDAEIVLLADLIEATGSKIYIAQGDDASWLDSGVPSGLSTLADNERTAIVYHSSDAQPADIAWAASRLVFDPDVQSAPWEGQVRDVAAITTITTAQRDFIATNGGNVAGTLSSADYYVSPGQTFTKRPVYEILSADWFKARITEDIAALKLAHTARGEKIIVDSTGQAKILSILRGRLQQGVSAHHFVKGQIRATAEAITVDDITNRRLRFKVEAQIAADARLFTINVYLQPEALQEA